MAENSEASRMFKSHAPNFMSTAVARRNDTITYGVKQSEWETYTVREKKTVPQTLINMFYSKSFERNIYLLDYSHRRLHFTGTWTLRFLSYFACIQSFAVCSLRHTFSHTHTVSDDIYSTEPNARVKYWNCILWTVNKYSRNKMHAQQKY